MSKSARFTLALLFGLVLLSLALNGYIIWQLWLVQREARTTIQGAGAIIQESLDQTIADLEEIEQDSIEFDLVLDQEFPVDTDIAFNDPLEVPVQMNVPISETIETVIFIELVGGVEVPVDIAVPVDVVVPIDTTVAIPVDQSIPLSITVPLSVAAPIKIDISESPLAAQVARFRRDLIELNRFIEQWLAEVE